MTADLDRRAENLRWSPNSAAIFFTAANEGAFPLYRVARTGGAPERLTPDLELGVRAFDIGRDQRVQIVTTPKNPSEMFVGPALGAETGSAGFAALTAHARRAAKAAGLKPADVPRAIKKVRRVK